MKIKNEMVLKRNYFIRTTILFIFLIITFSILYYLWYFKINSQLAFSNLFKDPFYLSSLAKIALETIVVTLIVIGVNILHNLSLKFYQIIYVVVIAEFVFLLQAIYEFIWLLSYKKAVNIQNFSSLSIYNIINLKQIPEYFHFALQTINLWELFYVFALVIGVKNHTSRSFLEIFKLISVTYVISLFVWIILVTFIQISQV